MTNCSPFDMAETLHAVENVQARKNYGGTIGEVNDAAPDLPRGILERCLNQLEREGFVERIHDHYTAVRKGTS